MRKKVNIITGIIVLALIGIQFVPVDRTNPPIVDEVDWDSEETREIAKRACFDCHSNETIWPWYSYVAPLSFRIAHHVDHGREHLNFSDWTQPNESFDEIKEVMDEGEMPLWDYLLMHSDAKLTPEETETLLSGLYETYRMNPPVERRRGGPPPEGSDD